MIHKGTKELHTERLILRRFTVDDAKEMFDNWANDAEVTKFLTWQPHGKIEVTKALLEDWVIAYQNPNCYNWGIVYDKKLIGSIGFLNPNDDLSEAEIGYCMSKEYWGMRIMAEALSAIIEFAFKDVGLKRLHAKHDVNNPNSGKVMIKCGMVYIGTANKPLELKTDETYMYDCYEILNANHTLWA